MDFWLAHVQVSQKQLQRLWVQEWKSPVMSRGYCFAAVLLDLCRWPFRPECSYSFLTLWPVVSLCITHSPLWKKKLLWYRLRASLIYGHREKSLEGGVAVCPFNKMIVVGSLLRSMTFPSKSSLSTLQGEACVLSCGVSLKSITKQLVTPLTCMPLLHPRVYLARILL